MAHKTLLSRDYSAMKGRFSAVGCEFPLPAGENRKFQCAEIMIAEKGAAMVKGAAWQRLAA